MKSSRFPLRKATARDIFFVDRSFPRRVAFCEINMFPCRVSPLLSRHLPPPRVSIRAPNDEETTQQLPRFQSTRPLRRDIKMDNKFKKILKFQSTRPLGRDDRIDDRAPRGNSVSIHAPVRARRDLLSHRRLRVQFQSTRPLGRDRRSDGARSPPRSFNPRAR